MCTFFDSALILVGESSQYLSKTNVKFIHWAQLVSCQPFKFILANLHVNMNCIVSVIHSTHVKLKCNIVQMGTVSLGP